MSVAQANPIDAARRMEELGRIILAYSDVTEKLQKSHDQLTHTVQMLQAELGEKNRQLERRNRLAALGEMAAGMAHEIRNPLGGIQLYASMLARDVADRPASLQVVHKIAGGVRRLEALVTQVLQFTREIRPNVAAADLASIVQQSVELAEAVFGELKVSCQVEGPASLSVEVDAALMGQAILNLLRNGAEACEPGGWVKIAYDRAPDSDTRHFHLVVTDSGSGIAPDVLERIFNPFFTTKDNGTGLGLAIVHRIIEGHDGSITVCNGSHGGARFEVRV